MTNLNISLPDNLEAFVKEQTALKGFNTPSDYIRALLREAQNHADRAKLEGELLAALHEEPAEMEQADWERLRERVRRAAAEA